MTAAAAGQLDAVANALASPHVQVNAQDRFGFTAIMKAAAAGHADIVRLLIKAGADLDVRDRAGSTALTRAVVGDHAPVVKALLQAGAKAAASSADRTRKTLLHITAERGHEGIILQLVHAGASLEAKYWDDATPLLLAADTGHPTAVRALIEAGADIEAKDKHHRTALLRAATHGHFAVVQMLLDHGANVQASDSEGNSALMLAATKGYKSTAACLVANGADINAMSISCGYTALMAAAERDGHEDVVRLLLDHGADRSLLNHNKKTAAELTADRRIKKLLRLPIFRTRSNRLSVESQPRLSDMQPEPEPGLQCLVLPNEPESKIDSLEELCNAMGESAFVFNRVRDRLELVQTDLSSSINQDQQLRTLVSSFHSFLRRNVGNHPMVRLMHYKEYLKTCYDLHSAIDRLQPEVSCGDNWKNQWTRDAKTLRELFVRTLRECKMPESERENEKTWCEMLKLLSLESNQSNNSEERYLMHKYLQHAARSSRMYSSVLNTMQLGNE